MKTKTIFLFALLFSFIACEKEAIETVPQTNSDSNSTTIDYRQVRDCSDTAETIAGQFVGELTSTWTSNENGYTTHTMSLGAGKGYVVDANVDRIVFRSTTHKLGKQVLIHNMGCEQAHGPCVHLVQGDTYKDGLAYYVKISSEGIYDCMTAHQESFDFKYALVGFKL